MSTRGTRVSTRRRRRVSRAATRRRRRLTALVALSTITAAFLLGAIVGAGQGSSYRRTLAEQFAQAWAKGRWGVLYADLAPASRGALTPSALAALYRQAGRTATATAQRVRGRPRTAPGGAMVVPVRVATRLFGTLEESFTLRFAGSGEAAKILWTASLQFPGLRAHETLTRRMQMPPRAALLTREGSVLASGPAEAAGERASPLGAAASAIVGTIGPIPANRQAKLEAEGVPPNAIVGLTGLERIFDSRLRGQPGGQLLAGTRVIADATSHASPPVRTTISARIQSAVVEDLGGKYGGVVALQPSTGEVLGVAGLGLDDAQPPGSTFKMVTVTSILQNKVATPSTTFPDRTYAVLEGVRLNNAESESCGGTLILAFAVSCNSVFAPLGVKLGAQHLVATAEQYGFNREPTIPGAVQSTIPQPSGIHGEMELGASSIGQGKVLASPLEMASIAGTIANGGVLEPPTLALRPSAAGRRVSSTEVAHEVRNMMIHVVREGTGRNAAIPGVVVAGKTGTAELGTPTGCSTEAAGGASGEGAGGATGESGEATHSGEGQSSEGRSGCSSKKRERESTDAWFAAFAPAESPKLAIGVLVVRDGYGAESAAPIAKEVLEAGLQEAG